MNSSHAQLGSTRRSRNLLARSLTMLIGICWVIPAQSALILTSDGVNQGGVTRMPLCRRAPV
jgi:hypothetical protein